MILQANIRDATFIGANLRESDRLEALAQIRSDGDLPFVIYAMCQTPYAWIAYHEGQPVAFFGATAMSAVGVSVWGLATDRLRHVVKNVTRFVRGPAYRQLVRDGYHWAEARVATDNRGAMRWVEALGGVPVLALPGYGRGGEHFTLHRWHVDGVS